MFRVNFKMGSAISGYLSSNTIFGLFCNVYKRLEGNSKLEELLEGLYKGENYLAFSNPLKEGTFDFIDYEEVETSHASINRETSIRNDIYTVSNKVIESFDVIVRTNLDIDKYLRAMEGMSIGSRTNVGNGYIDSITYKEEEERETRRVLSDYVVSKDMPKLVKVDYYIRRGITKDREVQRPIIVFKGGEETNSKKEIIGRIVKDEETNSYFNGIGVIA